MRARAAARAGLAAVLVWAALAPGVLPAPAVPGDPAPAGAAPAPGGAETRGVPSAAAAAPGRAPAAVPPGRGAVHAALAALALPGGPLSGSRVRRVAFLPARPGAIGDGLPRLDAPPAAWTALVELAAPPPPGGEAAVAAALARFPGLAGFRLFVDGVPLGPAVALPRPPSAPAGVPPSTAGGGPAPGPDAGRPAPPVAVAAVRLRVALTGDVSLGRRVAGWIRQRGADYPWHHVGAVLRAADVAVINLESPLTDRGAPLRRKGIWLRGDPAAVAGLQRAGVDAAVVANNHSLDFGRDGFVRSLEVLEAAGIVPVGGGRDAAEAGAPRVLEAGGLRLCLLAYTPFALTWWHPAERLAFLAGPDRPGVLPPDPPRVAAAIAACRRAADVVLVSLHWGEEDVPRPAASQRALARQLVEAGADAVVGHHPHRLQGIEYHRGRPILYSLGNLVFDQRREHQRQGAVAVLRWPERAVELHPVRIEEGQPRSARGAERRAILEELRRLSAELGTPVEVPAAEGAPALAVPPGTR